MYLKKYVYHDKIRCKRLCLQLPPFLLLLWIVFDTESLFYDCINNRNLLQFLSLLMKRQKLMNVTFLLSWSNNLISTINIFQKILALNKKTHHCACLHVFLHILYVCVFTILTQEGTIYQPFIYQPIVALSCIVAKWYPSSNVFYAIYHVWWKVG